MIRIANKYLYIAAAFLISVLSSCSNDIEGLVTAKRGVPAVAEVTVGKMENVETRAIFEVDNRSVAAFSNGDKVGFYAVAGKQNLNEEEDYSLPIVNETMNYEGMINGKYKFGNPDLLIDPETVNSKPSKMYYPYYPDMPPMLADRTTVPGIPLREKDPQTGIERCIDFMYTSGSSITLANGVLLSPTFEHYFGVIGIQRGAGFDNPKDGRIYVVMERPYTHVRIYQTSETGAFSNQLQNLTDVPESELITEIVPGENVGKVNKNRVWETWQGQDYKGVPTYYMISPQNVVSFIVIQDNHGKWQKVADFYLENEPYKVLNFNKRFILKIQQEGIDVTIRPVAIEDWDDEIEISDNRKVGIHDFAEYNDWAYTYNSYRNGEQNNPTIIARLRAYGDSKTNTVTGEIEEWTFYINNDIDFSGGEFYQVMSLNDRIEGSSTYKNYVISNIKGMMFGEIGPKGSIGSLDFDNIYLIQDDSDNEPYSPLIGKMEEGKIDKCNINNAIVVAHSPVGMVAGSVNGGSITNCTFSGDAIGLSSAEVNGAKGLFGTIERMPSMTNVYTKGLKFIENN